MERKAWQIFAHSDQAKLPPPPSKPPSPYQHTSRDAPRLRGARCRGASWQWWVNGGGDGRRARALAKTRAGLGPRLAPLPPPRLQSSPLHHDVTALRGRVGGRLRRRRGWGRRSQAGFEMRAQFPFPPPQPPPSSPSRTGHSSTATAVSSTSTGEEEEEGGGEGERNGGRLELAGGRRGGPPLQSRPQHAHFYARQSIRDCVLRPEMAGEASAPPAAAPAEGERERHADHPFFSPPPPPPSATTPGK